MAMSLFTWVWFAAVWTAGGARLTEQQRVAQWHRLNYTWPPNRQPETEGFRQLMDAREQEIMRLPGTDERWENWLQQTQSRLLRTFTHDGYAVAQIPPEVFGKLKAAVDSGLERFDSLPEEMPVDAIFNERGLLPKFVHIGNLAREAMLDMLPLHEAWAGGVKLRGTSAYGVRLYRNGSSLAMHTDKLQTHVISSISHIAHRYDNDSEPWPIQIENHRTGELVSVNLEPGQMLFYESAKCLHGRMTEFKGEYYGSIFIHYAPTDREDWPYRGLDEVIDAVPPHWKDGLSEAKGGHWAGAAITVPSRRASGSHPRPGSREEREARAQQQQMLGSRKSSDVAQPPGDEQEL